MIERLLDRTEEGAAFAAAFLRGEPIGDAIEIVVLPAIVARHALHICAVDHGCEHSGRGRFWARPTMVTPRARTWPARRSPRKPRARGSQDRKALCGRP